MTQLENIEDRKKKGRTRNGNKYGELSHLARYNDTVVQMIRESNLTGKELSWLFGISEAQVSRIRNKLSRNS